MAIDGVKSLSDPVSVANMKKYVEELLKKNLYSKENPSSGNPIIAYKAHIDRVSRALSSTQGLDFIAFQGALKLMNPGPIGTGKVLSPLTPFGPPPGGEGIFTDSADIPVSYLSPLVDNTIMQDKLKHEGKKTLEEYKSKEYNLYDSEHKTTDYFYIDNDQPESGGTDGNQLANINGVQYSVPDYASVFEAKSVGFDFGTGEKGTKSFKPNKSKRAAASEKLRRRRAALENNDSFFIASELETGYVTAEQAEQDGLSDATNYMPFFLEDMRSGGKRIYLRAFFKGLSEQITPSWSQENYFGRVDPVGIYNGTSRNVSVNFAMVALSPAGFTAMWRKLNVMAKLLYPTFQNGTMVKAPVCRLRIGDVICDQAGAGLTGYISSPLSLDYTDSPWEISEWTGFANVTEMGKAPQLVMVSFTFQVIHERQPYVDADYNFDTTFFRRVGGLTETSPESTEILFTEENVYGSEDGT
jgi:hypothetical protein